MFKADLLESITAQPWYIVVGMVIVAMMFVLLIVLGLNAPGGNENYAYLYEESLEGVPQDVRKAAKKAGRGQRFNEDTSGNWDTQLRQIAVGDPETIVEVRGMNFYMMDGNLIVRGPFWSPYVFTDGRIVDPPS
jgi:hypothetical protein